MTKDSSLWIGNDLEAKLPALQVNCEGKVLRKLHFAAVSVAVDPSTNRIFFNNGFYAITTLNLNQPRLESKAIGPVYPGDMAFVDGKIWVANATDKSLDWIDPKTGAVGREIQLPFRPRGITYDGGGFWLTAFDDEDHLVYVTSSVKPCPCKDSEACELGQVDKDFDLEIPVYALAWDYTNSTLWAGTEGSVLHISTSGQILGSFPIEGRRYVAALEFQGPGRPQKSQRNDRGNWRR